MIHRISLAMGRFVYHVHFGGSLITSTLTTKAITDNLWMRENIDVDNPITVVARRQSDSNDLALIQISYLIWVVWSTKSVSVMNICSLWWSYFNTLIPTDPLLGCLLTKSWTIFPQCLIYPWIRNMWTSGNSQILFMDYWPIHHFSWSISGSTVGKPRCRWFNCGHV